MGKQNNKTNTAAAAKPKFVSDPPAKEQKPKREWRISEKIANWVCVVAVVAFAAFAAWLLVGRNSDMLFQAQNFSFFNYTQTFFDECMRLPGGLIAWASSYLTQYFYHPEIGAAIMIALWVLTYFVAKKALGVSSLWAGVLLVPCLALLTSVIDNGYWLYYIKQLGFWFYATLGFLISMLLTWVAKISSRKTITAVAMLAIAFTYPLFGYYSLLALLYAGIVATVNGWKSGGSLIARLSMLLHAIALVILTPMVAYHFYANVRFVDLWIAGYTFFVADDLVSLYPQVPFLVMAVSPVLLALLPKLKEARAKKALACVAVNVAVLVAGAYIVEKRDFQDYNYHAEMRMYRSMENQDWDGVLDEMAKIPHDANRQMVMFKNISLLNRGDIGDNMFKYNNMGNNPKHSFDTLHVHIVQTGAPLIYYNHGKTNFAIRWCIENGVEYGPKFCNMKTLALCSIVNGEWDAARKYLTILKNSKYYKEWAEHLMPLVDNPKLISKYHEFDNVLDLYNHMGSVLDGDNGLCEMYLLNYFSNTMNKDSKQLQELTLDYTLIQKDIDLFWPKFFLYANLHKGEEMPIHYQEAAFLYGNLEQGKVNIGKMPFNREKVINRYYSFQQMSQQLMKTNPSITTKDLGEAMKPAYGDTFYWFYFFCRDINSY